MIVSYWRQHASATALQNDQQNVVLFFADCYKGRAIYVMAKLGSVIFFFGWGGCQVDILKSRDQDILNIRVHDIVTAPARIKHRAEKLFCSYSNYKNDKWNDYWNSGSFYRFYEQHGAGA